MTSNKMANSKLLSALKYIVEHPEQGINGAFKQPRFRGVYKDFIEYRAVKYLRCPIIIPRGNGGWGKFGNYIYLCRRCHDHLHEMDGSKLIKYLKNHPEMTVEEVVKTLKVKKEKVIRLKYPGYYLRCKTKYEVRVTKKLTVAMEKIFGDSEEDEESEVEV